jgi:STE24 endopeptidase
VPTVLIVSYLATLCVRLFLSVLNVRHRRQHGSEVPPEFASSIESSTLEKSSAYNADREAFEHVQLAVSAIVVLGFLFGGGLRAYDAWLSGWVHARVGQGVLFFVGLSLASSLLDLPFDAFATFRIEQRHGFNRTTAGLFFNDWFKNTLLGSLLAAIVVSAGLSLYYAAPQWYWAWFWGFAIAFAVLMMLIAPAVIEPLFIKTTPLTKLELAEAVRHLAARAGVTVNRVLQVDASRRSSHSNAYFTGIGRVKRVVLFDTLLERLTDAEVLSVLGHELGHWKLRHITQRLVTTALLALVSLYGASRLLAWDGFAAFVGLPGASISAQLVVLGFIASLLGFVVTPLSAFWSRVHEKQADAFATELMGHPQALASALVKLAQDNLTNLHPHPWYAAFYFSHPPTTLRVRRLLADEQKTNPLPRSVSRSSG